MRLKTARLQANLSQEELAHQAGLHRTYIGSVERGDRNASLLNVITLATSLQVDPGTLIAGLSRLGDTAD